MHALVGLLPMLNVFLEHTSGTAPLKAVAVETGQILPLRLQKKWQGYQISAVRESSHTLCMSPVLIPFSCVVKHQSLEKGNFDN